VMFHKESAPFLGGFDTLRLCARKVSDPPIDCYTMEVKRQLDVLDRHPGGNLGEGGPFLCGDQ
jgi:hypothetical protein